MFEISSVSAAVLQEPVLRDGKLMRGALLCNEVDNVVQLLPALRQLFILIERRGWHGINAARHADIKFVEDSTTLPLTRRLFPNTPLLELGNADFVDHAVFRPLDSEPEYDVIQICCWSPRKRIELMLDAATLLPDVSFVHLGHFERGGTPDELSYRDGCLRCVRDDGSRVTFAFGHVDSNLGVPTDKAEVNKWINRARIGVLTSAREGYNRFKMECMAADRPILIAQDTATPTQKYVTPETGMLYAPNGQALADAIRYALDHRQDFRPREYLLARTGRERAVTKLRATLKEFCAASGDVYHFDNVDWDGRNERFAWGEEAVELLRGAIRSFLPAAQNREDGGQR